MIFESNLWMGSEESLATILELLNNQKKKHGSLKEADLEAQMKMKALASDSDEEPDFNPVEVELVDNVAVISVNGPTISHSSFFSQIFGIASYDDIQERFNQVAEEASIDTVLMELDTPGGNAGGVPEMSDYISAYNDNIHPVIAYNSGNMFSAAMWYGTAGSSVMSGKYTRVGSVGVITQTQEVTKMLEEIGVSVEVFRSAPFKALGGPYEKMTDKSRGVIQEMVDETHQDFVSALSNNRNLSPEKVVTEIATGKTFRAQKGVELGLVDAIMPLEEVVARLINTPDY